MSLVKNKMFKAGFQALNILNENIKVLPQGYAWKELFH
jgi:hypothetical protein